MSDSKSDPPDVLQRLRNRRQGGTGTDRNEQAEGALTREIGLGPRHDDIAAPQSDRRVSSPIPAAQIDGTSFHRGSSGTCGVCLDLPHPTFTHCVRCHASWRRASATAHCMGCHRTFSRPRPFDEHWKGCGEGTCHDPAIMKKRDGRPIFGEPRPNVAGTLIWRLAGEPVHA